MCMGVDKKSKQKINSLYWQQKEGYVLTFLYTMWSTHGWGGGEGVTDHSHSMKFVHSKLIISACVFLHQFVQNVLECRTVRLLVAEIW